MRRHILSAAFGLLAIGVACKPSYLVHTVVAPEASVARLRSFRIDPVPPPRDGRASAGPYDPMVDNSITNRALRDEIERGFIARGYVLDRFTADFAVAVYASASTELDPAAWDYGYSHGRPGRPWLVDDVSTYTAGTVIVDVFDPGSRELLWRGSATARMSEDPMQDMKELQRVARAIVKRFPQSTAPRLASVR